MKTILIDDLYAQRRIDRVIKVLFPSMPLSAIYKNLRIGKIKVNKKRVKPEYKLEKGQELSLYLDEEVQKPASQSKEMSYEKVYASPFFKKSWDKLFEDDSLLIVNKPAGVAVHPGTNHYAGRTMTDLAQSYAVIKLGMSPDGFLPTLVHRIDLETSGVLVFAKTPSALRSMNAQMKHHDMEKVYLALCNGVLEKDFGTIKVALERTEGGRSTKVIISKGGENARMAVTHYTVLKRFADATLIKVRIETGRMHQIRVHMKSQGHALWGDSHYGDFSLNKRLQKEPFKLKRMFLHAASLTFTHPVSQKSMKIEAPLPEELEFSLQVLKDGARVTGF